MATPTPQDKPSFFRTADSTGKDTRPTSLYQPRPSAFGQSTAPGASKVAQTTPLGGQPSAFAASRTTSPLGAARSSSLGGIQKPAAFGAKPATPAPKPFTSLRSQTGPQTTPQSAFSRFAQPAATPGAVGLGAKPPLGGVTRPATPGAASVTPSSPFRKELKITDEEFLLLRDFIYQQCGIFIAENRKYLVENRLSNRIKELNLKSYNEYYNYLRYDMSRNKELTKLFEVVTTNETSFFRNPPQLEVFQKVVLAEAIDQARKSGQKKLRIWSAGCSTGEEPYTLAIILRETLRTELDSWDVKITANDLSEAVLAAARQGIYNDYALRTTPKEITARYFRKEGNVYKIDPSLKRLVSFGQINLSNKEQLKRVERSQIVFCRNVIIYFDDDMKRKVINAFYDNLLPAGVLIIGHSESLHNISRSFQLEHHTGTILYRKLS